MLQLNIQNIFKTDPKSGIASADLVDRNQLFEQHRSAVVNLKPGFLALPDQPENIRAILDFTSLCHGRFDAIVVVGIGGSSLGPKCIWQALGGDAGLQVTILDNIDPVEVGSLLTQLNYSRTLFLVITKSGGTPETVASYLIIREKLINLELPIADHFVFITDPVRGYLRQVAETESIVSFPIPSDVGGRFSVLSSVGLVLGGLLGLDLIAMLRGAADEREHFLHSEAEVNRPWQIANTQCQQSRLGKNITVIMPYSSRLKTFSDWYVQLLSESVGKAENRQGQQVNVGLTPVPALGATDQHSQLQLFREGPNDKLFIFIEIGDSGPNIPIPATTEPSLAYFKGHSLNQLFQAEFEATRQSLTENNRPNLTVKLDRVDEYHLGALFMLFEVSIALLGEFFEVDAFDQPGVERSKVLARENLAKL